MEAEVRNVLYRAITSSFCFQCLQEAELIKSGGAMGEGLRVLIAITVTAIVALGAYFAVQYLASF
ncbi:hypothetical protein LRP30_27675 [Bradyrhizobium sp. C-145]|uniref:hypothetical protein n=1 Tax=Bradyrhizobium sp. C-145 TaxID=574727 RepID=UPI00201B583F|nr:hypothetical protein [Bradyrhizobium sp. C-145]UQR60764.1 hypothetical protein LRP30_27675 [Bradyrhizobium sp. C-145]